MPLGSLLGPIEALLGGLWTPKTLDSAFKLFEALDGPLGLILPPYLAGVLPKLDPK